MFELSRRTTTFKPATAKQAIRIVDVPVKTIIAAIFQRTRPQARRRTWRIRVELTSRAIIAIDADQRPNSQTRRSPRGIVQLANDRVIAKSFPTRTVHLL